jgi:hypothetical protein
LDDAAQVMVFCIGSQAHLRLARVRFAVQECPWSSFSPTGSLPAFDAHNGELFGGETASDLPLDELSATHAIISRFASFENGLLNLDAGLTSVQRADLLALTTLIESKLVMALVHSTWCETDAYWKYTRPAHGRGLAFPLNYWLPWIAKKGVVKGFRGMSPDEIYKSAAAVLTALSARLLAASGADGDSFLLGSRPSSLDALAFACLAYIKAAPVVHPVLRDAFKQSAVLNIYLDRITERYFGTPVRAAAECKLEWMAWGPSTARRREQSQQNAELERKGRLWLMGAAAAIGGYLLLSEQYFGFGLLEGEPGEDDDGEEE